MDLSKLTDLELDAILCAEDHPLYDDALDEEATRDECAGDSRVAQALGRAAGEQPS